MGELIRSKQVKVKKQHKCFGCYSIIEIGEISELNVNVFDGSIYNLYYCSKCVDFIKKFCDNCQDDCIEDGMFSDGHIQECENYKNENEGET